MDSLRSHSLLLPHQLWPKAMQLQARRLSPNAGCVTRSAPAPRLVGPQLNGVVGRKAASVGDYTMYSAGMKKLGEQGFVWNEQNIDKWIANPKAMIPDSPMALAFQGIPDAGERTDIIAYLKTVPAQ